MMRSGCRSLGCVDVPTPVRATYVNLYKWPESDAEFVKSVAEKNGDHITGFDGKRTLISSPVVDSYACRQMFLRSYTFSKPESFPEKTRRRIGKFKDRAAVFFPLLRPEADESSARSDTNCIDDAKKRRKTAATSTKRKEEEEEKKKKKKKKKSSGTARKLREVSCSTMQSIFRRLLSFTTRVDVVEGGWK